MSFVTITLTEAEDDKAILSWDFGPDYEEDNPTPLQMQAQIMISMYVQALSEQGEHVQPVKEH